MRSCEATQEQECKVNCADDQRNHPDFGSFAVEGFSAGLVYHDLRHPLTAILAYSEFLAEYELSKSERQGFHQEIRSAVDRMNDLLSLLLEASKGVETSRPEAADIAETVNRALQSIAARPDFGRISISYTHQGLTTGWFDSARLQQVITNLVLNACEAISPGIGRIEIGSAGQEDRLEISVSDNGPGIPESIRDVFFQPFVTHGKRGGTGLGLAIVQKILRDRGGDIHLDATSENGTRFRIVYPYHGARGHKAYQTQVRSEGSGGQQYVHRVEQ